MGKRKLYNKRIILPFIHFLMTFVFERFILMPSDALSVSFSVPLNNRFSVRFEQIMCYTVSKLMAFVIIVLLWKLCFWLFSESVKRTTRIMFVSVFAVMILLTIIRWPDNFVYGGDNYIPYSYALRLMPEYWHSVLLSCLYTASFMVLPHSVSIVILQAILFTFSVLYLYYRIENSDIFSNCRWIRFLTLLMFVFKDTFDVSNNPERAEYNASFCLIFVTVIVMDIVEKKKRTLSGFAGITLFAAFLSVFRSEGIIPAVLGYAALVIIVYKPDLKKGVITAIAFILLVFIISLPGKVGEIKYYGRDYSIINSFQNLSNILNNPNSNLNYKGVENDLEAIDSITPIEYIKEYGAIGYRSNNYSKGYKDINQSLAGKEKSDAFMSAYFNMCIHNPGIYVRTQLTMLLSAMGSGVETYREPYIGAETELAGFEQDMWEVGRLDITQAPGWYRWTRIGIRNRISNFLAVTCENYMQILLNTGIYFVLFVLEIIMSIVIAFVSIFKAVKKDYIFLSTGVFALILDAYFVLLALVMPVGANMYFHAYIYSMFALIILFTGMILRGRND